MGVLDAWPWLWSLHARSFGVKYWWDDEIQSCSQCINLIYVICTWDVQWSGILQGIVCFYAPVLAYYSEISLGHCLLHCRIACLRTEVPKYEPCAICIYGAGGVPGFQCYDHAMDQDGCEVLAPLGSMHRWIIYEGFIFYFSLGGPLFSHCQFSVSLLGRSWLKPVIYADLWFSYRFIESCGNTLVDVVVTSWKRNVSGELGTDWVLAVPNVSWLVPSLMVAVWLTPFQIGIRLTGKVLGSCFISWPTGRQWCIDLDSDTQGKCDDSRHSSVRKY